MKWIALLFFAIVISSCKKENCKTVTVRVINGCTNPVTTTYIVTDHEYCGVALDEIRKQAGYVDVPTGSGICRITTLVTEK